MTYENLSEGRHRIVVVAKCACATRRDVKRYKVWIGSNSVM